MKVGSLFKVSLNRKILETISIDNIEYDEFSVEDIWIYLEYLKVYIADILENVSLFKFGLKINNEIIPIYYKDYFKELGEKENKEKYIEKVTDDLFISFKEEIPKIYIINKEIGALIKNQ